MIRETLNANSRHTLMWVTPGNGFQLRYRSATAGITSSASDGALYPTPNNWVRLVRKGSTVKCYKSRDGLTWTQVGATLRGPPATEIYVGLAVTSCDTSQRGTARSDRVTVVP